MKDFIMIFSGAARDKASAASASTAATRFFRREEPDRGSDLPV
jgi:hypothetical protein